VPALRLLTVNARALPLDRAALASLIEEAGPDVACVHGSPSLLRWRSISAALARRAGMVVVSGGRTGGANLLLSTLGVDVVATRDLRFAGPTGLRPPGATLAVLRLRGSEFVLAAAQLVGNEAVRRRQAGELQAAIAGLVPSNPPVVISAQGANGSNNAAWQVLSENRVGIADGIFVDGRIGIGEAKELPAEASSPPLCVELSLPDYNG
jgi:hypothetical protein